MPSDPPFLSFGGNAEDVVLHRALSEVTSGRYVEIGVVDPAAPSATRAFSDRGWRGLLVVPADGDVEGFRRRRPGDAVVQAPVAEAGAALDEHLPQGCDVHVLVVHADISSAGISSAGIDLRRWRPWVLVAAGTGPAPAEEEEKAVLDAGYESCLFDGVSRFYVAAECADRLRPALSVPAHVGDDFVPHRRHELERELAAVREELATLRAAHDDVLEELVRWRGTVLARWSDAVGASTGGSAGATGRGSHEVVRLREEIDAIRSTVSWRITAPLRALQGRRLREWR